MIQYKAYTKSGIKMLLEEELEERMKNNDRYYIAFYEFPFRT